MSKQEVIINEPQEVPEDDECYGDCPICDQPLYANGEYDLGWLWNFLVHRKCSNGDETHIRKTASDEAVF
jgi:hypothetical protein